VRYGPGGASTVVEVDAANTTYMDEAVEDGVPYSYTVSASNAGAIGPPSAAVQATPGATPLLPEGAGEFALALVVGVVVAAGVGVAFARFRRTWAEPPE
jgi:hypothetical protein